MGIFIANARTLAAAGTIVAVVHHHGKDGGDRLLKIPMASATAT
jgi:hypothetical protein